MNVAIAAATGGNASTVAFPKVRTRWIGVKVSDPRAWQLAAVRVRVPTFAGHLILREDNDTK